MKQYIDVNLSSTGRRARINVAHVVAVVDTGGEECNIITTDSDTPFSVDHAYDEVIDMISHEVRTNP